MAAVRSALVKAVPASGLVVLGTDTPRSAAMERMSAAPVRLVPGRGKDFSADAARIVGQYFGVPDETIERALSAAMRVAGRLDTVLLGWGQYRTPIRDLFLCSSGTHPGTGLTGGSGANAAREALRELR